jgi:hypothetical protein
MILVLKKSSIIWAFLLMVHPKVPGSCVNLSFKGMVHSLLFSDKKNRKKNVRD